MDRKQTAEELARLSWLETATVRAYDEVERKVTDEDLRRQLDGFRDDHARHLSRMHRLLEQTAGGVEPSAEFIAFVREELESIERTQDEAESLTHLLLMERANAAFFADALAADLPAEAAQLVSEQTEDEDRHLGEVAAHMPPVSKGAGGGSGASGEGGSTVIGSMAGEAGGGAGVTADGGLIPGAVPSKLPESPQWIQMQRAIEGKSSPTPEPPGYRAQDPDKR